jgi:hypothetical protein
MRTSAKSVIRFMASKVNQRLMKRLMIGSGVGRYAVSLVVVGSMLTGCSSGSNVAPPTAVSQGFGSATSSLPFVRGAACGFHLVTSPSPGNGNVLNAVSGVSSSDVWSVGWQYISGPTPYTLAEHFNGTAWSVVTTPNPSSNGNQLFAVTQVSTKNAWAVGWQNMSSSGDGQALITHWNGTAWSQVTAPPLSGQFAYLYNVTAITATNVWAVGQSIDANSDQPTPLAEHWNGKKWSVVASPNLGTYGSKFYRVSGTAADDVWAVGGTWTSSQRNALLAFAEHWNGKKWSVVKIPNANSIDDVLNGLVAIAPDDAWTVGDYYTGSIFRTFTEHWDGTTWKIVKSPDVGIGGDALFDMTAFSKTAVWAVGQVFAASSRTTLALKWGGQKWAVVKSPNLSGDNPDGFLGAAAIPGSTDLWAVGGSNQPSGNYDLTLTARYSCSSRSETPAMVTLPSKRR